MTGRVKKNEKVKKTHRIPTDLSESITIGDISGGTSFAIGRNAQSVVTQKTDEKNDLNLTIFRTLEQMVSTITDKTDKKVAESAIEALETEARKGEQADEKSIKKWMNFLAETAPDAWEVAIDFFVNPMRGVGTVFKKIAERAKLEREASTSKP